MPQGILTDLAASATSSHSQLTSISTTIAQTSTTPSPTRSAEMLYRQGQYQDAIDLWLQLLPQSTQPLDTAAIHANLGSAYRQVGQLDRAIQQWEQAIQGYRSVGDASSEALVIQLLIDQGQAYTTLGQYRSALPLLETALQQVRLHPDRRNEVAALGALGNAYLAAGRLDMAIATLEQALQSATQLDQPAYLAIAWNHLGNALYARAQRYGRQANTAEQEGEPAEQARLQELAKQDQMAAQTAYQRSLRVTAQPAISQVTALLNLVHLIQQGEHPNVSLMTQYQNQALALINQFPDSRAKVYALINLAVNLESGTQVKIHTLERSIAMAQQIGDARSLSFALGTLGATYEAQGDYTQAMNLTRQAQWAAQQVNAGDSLYRWQWQLGRLHQATGNPEAARLAYQQAVTTLQSIRSDIAAASKDVQFDVRDSVEPVYRELMALLLANTPTNPTSPHTQPRIQAALQVAELLKLTELQNFFGDECLEIARNSDQTTVISTNAATIHSLVLDRQVYLLLRLPNGELLSYLVNLTPAQLQQKIVRLRFTLENIATNEYLDAVQDVYNLLIRPMEPVLTQAHPDTLVFVQDGILRNIPMAALYDGKQFLVEKYAIATTLGTNLTPSRPRPTEQQALIFGLTVEVPPFPALPNVNTEVEEVQRIMGGNKFLDKDFTVEQLREKIGRQGRSLVHLATHGKFSADPESTFLQAFDSRISLEEMERILQHSQQPIDLLTLSACQTAAGDDRATLGIAGVAIRAGVNSVLASLWSINDADTVPLIEAFYLQLRQPNITKAEALRQAQLKIIANPDSHPALWSPFILIGNWT